MITVSVVVPIPGPGVPPCIVCPNCFKAVPRVTTFCLSSVTASWTSKSPGCAFASSSRRKKIGFSPANSVVWPTCSSNDCNSSSGF